MRKSTATVIFARILDSPAWLLTWEAVGLWRQPDLRWQANGLRHRRRGHRPRTGDQIVIALKGQPTPFQPKGLLVIGANVPLLNPRDTVRRTELRAAAGAGGLLPEGHPPVVFLLTEHVLTHRLDV
jgi:hypothetical protein